MEIAGIATGQPQIAAAGATISAVGAGAEIGIKLLTSDLKTTDIVKAAISLVSPKLGGMVDTAVKNGNLDKKVGDLTGVLIKAHEKGAQKISDTIEKQKSKNENEQN